jgi:hypothetical protein
LFAFLPRLESENPTGSMKDRVAPAMMEAAEADGRKSLGPHASVATVLCDTGMKLMRTYGAALDRPAADL